MKMMKVALSTLVLVLGTAGLKAQANQWKIDPNHSEADFTVRHMGISTVRGTFRGVQGVIRLDPNDVTKSSVEATIDTTGVDTGVTRRDTHLKSPDFLDVAKFPTMTFKSTSVRKAGDSYEVLGDLTLHGVTKPVVLKLDTPGKEQILQDNKPHRGFVATTTINRQDYGVKWQGTLKSGDQAVSDQVKIELDVEAGLV